MEWWDAVVIGAGPNGLVAANILADAGWDVLVLEAEDAPGGAVRTAEITAPGFRNDLFSAFYPLAARSPVLAALHLERHGLAWTQAPAVVAHPTPDGPTAVLHRSPEATAATLDRFAAGDGDAWLRLFDRWRRVGPPLVDALLAPFPPVRHGLRLAAALGPRGIVPFARFALLPARRLAEEHFRGAGGPLLLAGNALHSDVPLDAPPSGLLGWLLTSLGQEVGFPVPVGGAGELSAALVRRLERAGGRLLTGVRVDRVLVTGAGRGARARGVAVDGTEVGARRAVLADVDAERLFSRLVGREHLSTATEAKLASFQRGWGTVKVDWALRTPVPWRDPAVGEAGTVHLASSLDELTMGTAEILSGRLPTDPFVVFGQMTVADPTRSPPGTESAWAYTHVPARLRHPAGGGERPLSRADVDEVVRRLEDRVEQYAPGFGATVLHRHVLGPADLETWDANLVDGDIGAGTYQIHQQAVFRPWAGWGRAETPVENLYLASASAHPGGGVHGACGANAARAARMHDRLARLRGPGRRPLHD
jgi:phytoene dehydrogenase-like protein